MGNYVRSGRERNPDLYPPFRCHDRRRRRNRRGRPLLIKEEFQIDSVIQHIVDRRIDSNDLLTARRQRRILIQVTARHRVIPETDIQPNGEIVLGLLRIDAPRRTVRRRLPVARHPPAERQPHIRIFYPPTQIELRRLTLTQLIIDQAQT